MIDPQIFIESFPTGNNGDTIVILYSRCTSICSSLFRVPNLHEIIQSVCWFVIKLSRNNQHLWASLIPLAHIMYLPSTYLWVSICNVLAELGHVARIVVALVALETELIRVLGESGLWFSVHPCPCPSIRGWNKHGHFKGVPKFDEVDEFDELLLYY